MFLVLGHADLWFFLLRHLLGLNTLWTEFDQAWTGQVAFVSTGAETQRPIRYLVCQERAQISSWLPRSALSAIRSPFSRTIPPETNAVESPAQKAEFCEN